MTTRKPAKNLEAVALLQWMRQRGAPLRMSHSFKGLQFSQEIVLVKSEPNRAWFQLRNNPLKIPLGIRVALHSPIVEHELISAKATNLNLAKNEVELSDFNRQARGWVEHRFEEVQPRHAIRAILAYGALRLPVFLEDLSMGGLGLLAYKPVNHGVSFKVGDQVKVDFELPGGGGKLALAGRIAGLRPLAAHLILVGVETSPNPIQARALERYIAHRKVEILDELDLIFRDTLEPRGVKELYF